MAAAGFVSLAGSWFSFIKSKNAQSELDRTFSTGDCATLSECDRLRDLSHDSHVWMDRGIVLTMVGIGLVGGSLALAWFLPNRTRSRVSPSASVSKDGAAVGVGGRF